MTSNEAFSHRDQSASREQDRRPVEVIHNQWTDLMLNNNSRNVLYGAKLADEFEVGVPRGWQSLDSRYPNVRTGDVAGKQFVAKTRRHMLSPQSIQMVKKMEDRGHLTEFSSKQLYAFNSLTHEIDLAPDINAAMEEDWLQQAVADRGFKGVSYVEPVMGVLTRYPDGQTTKTMVYERIEDAAPLSGDNAESVTDVIRLALARQGITPDDLRPDQVLVDPEGHLYLTDAESYTKTV